MTEEDKVPALRILAAVVTYNRLALLKRSVEALLSQTHPPTRILVVDNSSTDGSREWLAAQPGITVIRQPNSGSAGGCFTAAKVAFEEGFDWVWMMDDDTIPRDEALERLVASPVLNREATGFVYSLQVYPNGKVPVNDPGPTGPDEWALTVLEERCVPVRRASFVALMVARRAISRAGYPMREMFFMGDDHEYTRRITDAGFRGFCVLDSIVLHDTKLPTSFDFKTWSPTKMRYSLRNHIYLIRTSGDPLTRKIRYIAAILLLEFKRLLTGGSNLTMIAWALKGFWFNPTAEAPANQDR
jgi:rhamnopyranosyl-N-acetylglucosaminyl-diphospho-decaprenol beta-1,3/1,4-galactofuranosyltransferase